MADLLKRMDAAIDGRCPCGAEPREGSAYCSSDCEPTHISTDTGWSGMRWRPDLVVAFDESDLELTDEITDCGLVDQLVGTARRRQWYRHRDGRRFLRLDDGDRWVGAFCGDETDRAGGVLWRRLERELTDVRRIEDDPVPAVTAAPDYFRIRTDDDCWLAYNLTADGVLDALQRWLTTNGVDPNDVVRNSDEHEIDEGQLHVECYVRNAEGHMLLDDTRREVRTEIRSVPLVESPPDVIPPVQAETGLEQLRRVDDLLRSYQTSRAIARVWLGTTTIRPESALRVTGA